jgi:truncated hemoglobin YjbI
MTHAIKITALAGALAMSLAAVAGCGDDGGSGGSGGSTSDGGSASDGGGTSDGGAGGGGVACDVCGDYGAAVPAVVSQIVDEAATDPQFEADFAPLVAAGPAAVDAFKTSLTNFITDAYGCTTGMYTGPSMEDAHAGMDITQTEYDAFVGLIAGVLADNGVPETDINECFAPALVDPTFANTIIGQ